MDTVRLARRRLAIAGAIAALIALAPAVRAEPHELRASVVWTREELIYVAAPDSGVLLSGMTLSIMRGKREVAQATISQLLEPRLAVARMSSGSLAREKRLDKLRVRGDAAAVARVATLRVGLPGAGRTNLLFACGTPGVTPRLGATNYIADSSPAGTKRWVRTPAAGDDASAPDTLWVRLYADAADEEIALERGELDAAVFWPGELSSRMRADARWRDAARGLRMNGVVAGVVAPSDSVPVGAGELAAVNRELFGDDLLAWSQLGKLAEPPTPSDPIRWTVDPTLPGARVIERVLARTSTSAHGREARLSFFDVPLAGRNLTSSDWRARGVTPLFAVRCPVLAAPAAHAIVSAIGADAFANLISCAGGTP